MYADYRSVTDWQCTALSDRLFLSQANADEHPNDQYQDQKDDDGAFCASNSDEHALTSSRTPEFEEILAPTRYMCRSCDIVLCGIACWATLRAVDRLLAHYPVTSSGLPNQAPARPHAIER
jgi:hypothetical protein